MEREVTLADLQEHLSDYVKAAQEGEEIVIKDGETRLARLSPAGNGKWPPYTIPAKHPIHSIDDMVGVSIPGITADDVEQAYKESRRDRLDAFWNSDPSTSTPR